MNPSDDNTDNVLGTKPIGPLLIQMAVPAMIAMGVNALYNLVDTIFVGRIVGPLGIGGIAIAFPMQIAVLAVSLLVGIGSASTISRSLGRGEQEKAAHVIGNALVLILGAVAVVAILSLSFLNPLLHILGSTEDLRPFARDYLSVILPGSPFLAMAIVANHLVRSEGRARQAMTIMLLGAGLNIILDPIFIYLLDMGVRGAAIATVISQAVSFGYAAWFYVSGKSSLSVGFRHIRFHWEITREVLAIGLASFVRQIAQSIFVVITNNVLRGVGDEIAISAFGVINKLLIFSLMPLIGIAQGFQPIAGYNYGAGNMRRVREAVKIASIAAITIAFFYFLLVMVFPRTIYGVFTTDQALLDTGSVALRIVSLAIVLVGFQLVGAVFFQSVGMAGPALVLGLLRQAILLIPLVLILPRFLGVRGVWWSFPIADAVAAAVTVIWLRYEMKKLHIIDCPEGNDGTDGCE
ncbi:MAG: MATE family efflux transporter [Spirochaeta sp.]|jgi:putative MATE family efflux protein|nr:MATE family efflux transporter [Spirochaeta sp.]